MTTATTSARMTLTAARPGRPFARVGERLEAQLGETLAFRFTLDDDHDVVWTGAEPTRTTLRASVAVARFTTRGEHVVHVDALDLDGRRIAGLTLVVDVTARGASQNRHARTPVRSEMPHASH